MTLESELDRMLVEHRHQRLLFERAHAYVVPRVRRVVRDVRQRHRVARMLLAGRADRACVTVAEGETLLMAIGARLRLVQ